MFKIKNKLQPPLKSIGQSFIELQSVDSTNNYATALIHEGMAQHGTVVFAHRQTKGKGQRNKSWITGDALNIAMSVIVETRGLDLSKLFLLSMASANAVYNFFNHYAIEQTKVKWPNDLYWNDRKAGGILIENILSGSEWRFAVVGIGININQTSFLELENKAVSLKQITGKDYDVLQLANELCIHLEQAYKTLFIDEKLVISDYHNNLYKLNEQVRLKKGTRVFNATIKGVTQNGELITQQATEELFSVGEIEWII